MVKIYFMGIKGVGMATLAIIAKEAGFIVGGSDIDEEFITDKILRAAGIEVRIGFREENIREFFGTTPKGECFLIATAAHEGFNNIEAVFARENGYRVVSLGEAVGLSMSGKLFQRSDIEGISISGSHGKTTITGMIATALSKLNMDPSYTAGTSEIFPIGAAGHYGHGRYFVAEADEYLSESEYDRVPKLLYQSPKYLIINNIDFDHPDFFKNVDDIKQVYVRFISQLDSGTVLIANGDDKNIQEVFEAVNSSILPNISVITYGTDTRNEFIIKNFKQKGFNSQFEAIRNGTMLGEFKLSVPGYFNAKNSLAVIALLIEIGISVLDIQKALSEFKGVKRRLEKVGETKDAVLIFDDYAHHPEEIIKTLEALKVSYPHKKITLIFQAHTYSRTKAMIDSFASSFAGVSELIILPTFASARDISGHDMGEDKNFVEKIRAIQPNVKFIETREGVIEYIRQNVKGPDKLVITMGAGDVYKISEKLSVRQAESKKVQG